MKKEVNGYELEPIEEVKIEATEEHVTKIMDRILARHGVILSIDTLENGKQL